MGEFYVPHRRANIIATIWSQTREWAWGHSILHGSYLVSHVWGFAGWFVSPLSDDKETFVWPTSLWAQGWSVLVGRDTLVV